MIARDGPWIELACDECGELAGDAFDKDEFAEMLADGRRKGWKTVPGRHRGDWDHRCKECQIPPDADDAFDEEVRVRFDPDIEALLGEPRDR